MNVLVSKNIRFTFAPGISMLIINTHASLYKLPSASKREPHLALPSIPVDVMLGNAVIGVHASLVGLFQFDWKRAVWGIFMGRFQEAQEPRHLVICQGPHTSCGVLLAGMQPHIVALFSPPMSLVSQLRVTPGITVP
jgi:hypothetical protein